MKAPGLWQTVCGSDVAPHLSPCAPHGHARGPQKEGDCSNSCLLFLLLSCTGTSQKQKDGRFSSFHLETWSQSHSWGVGACLHGALAALCQASHPSQFTSCLSDRFVLGVKSTHLQPGIAPQPSECGGDGNGEEFKQGL